MIRQTRRSRSPGRINTFLLVAMVLVILFVGLWPKGLHPENGAALLVERPGIGFTERGIAYAPSCFPGSEEDGVGINGFTIQLALKSETRQERRFRFILSLHNGRDSDQLLVAQWESSIIIMNGDDYSHRRRLPRMTLPGVLEPVRPLLLTICSGPSGTTAWVDSRLIKADAGLRLDLPAGRDAILTLGNSVYGTNSWLGETYGLAFYDRAVNESEIASGFAQWSRESSFEFAKAYGPTLLYVFDRIMGTRVPDRSGNDIPLEIPKRARVLRTQILSVDYRELQLDRGFVVDVLANLLGFIPLGFLWMAFLRGSTSMRDSGSMVLGILFCLLLSLGIEIAQAWMPSRSSNLHDLLLNTAGGALGALVNMKIGGMVLGVTREP